VVTGEASGDQHGARMVSALRRLGGSQEALVVYGVGADQLEAAGVELIADSRTISVIGLFEALRVLPQAFRVQRRVLHEVDRRRPDLAVLIDSPDFNLPLAKKLHARGIPVAYFISPQVWAWRRSRVNLIRRVVDRMLVLFPFEADFYREHDIAVEYVGHPLVDEVPRLESRWDAEPPPQVGADGLEGRTVVLLPGSRRSEVERLLPLMLEVGRRLLVMGVNVRLVVARSLSSEWIRQVAERTPAAGLGGVELVDEERFEEIAGAHAALCASGTATLEVGLLGTPMVVVYKVSRLTYWLGRHMVKVPSISLVNLVLGERVVPELLQHDAEPEGVLASLVELLRGGEATQTMRRKLGDLRHRLGSSGASVRAARAVQDLLTHSS
jgi:lipid-A-disaccharide synthase